MAQFTMSLKDVTFTGQVKQKQYYLCLSQLGIMIGSSYANFAGHDASRGLAKNSFDKEMMVDPYGPIDKLEDLESDDWESLRDWVNR
jgi:hypothetical protein